MLDTERHEADILYCKYNLYIQKTNVILPLLSSAFHLSRIYHLFSCLWMPLPWSGRPLPVGKAFPDVILPPLGPVQPRQGRAFPSWGGIGTWPSSLPFPSLRFYEPSLPFLEILGKGREGWDPGKGLGRSGERAAQSRGSKSAA